MWQLLPCVHWWKQRGRHCEDEAHGSHCSRQGVVQSKGYVRSLSSPMLQCRSAAAVVALAAEALLRGAAAAMRAASAPQSAWQLACCSTHCCAQWSPTHSWCLALSHLS